MNTPNNTEEVKLNTLNTGREAVKITQEIHRDAE